MRLGPYLPLAASAFLVACGDPAGSRSGEAQVWSVASEPEVVIGQLDGDSHYLFQRIADARLLPDGRFAVADRGMANIRVFGGDGSFQQTMGRSGEGPGEFQYLGSMEVYPPDTIAVYDPVLYRFTSYLADGTLVSTVNLRGEGGRAPELFLGRFRNGDFALASILHSERDPKEVAADRMQLDRFAPDGTFVSVLGMASGLTRHDAVFGPMPFSPYLHAFVWMDTIYWTDGVDSLLVRVAGSTVRTIELPSVQSTYSDAEAELRSRLEGLERPEYASRLADAPAAPAIPDVAEVLLDDQGRFWAKRYEPGTDSNWLVSFTRRKGGEWWIMEPTGEVTATIQLPPDLTPLHVRGDRIVGLSTDELDVERIVVWRFSKEMN